MRGRIAPKGESAAALRLRAHQQKMAMRAARAAAAAAERVGIAPAAPTTWVNLGPSPLASKATGNLVPSQDYNWVSGRATSVLIDPADDTGNTVLLGGAYGGLWRSTNAGSKSATPDLVSWQPLIDDQPTLAVGAIALEPTNSNVILVGTGETNSSGDSYYGLGILRSTDGGVIWNQITSAQSGQSFLGVGFSKIAFSTANPNLVVASTAGDIGLERGLEQDGFSTARGLYFSADAGATWNRVILQDNGVNVVAASATGVVYNPSQGASGTFYAAVRRHGLYSSTDGQHFTRLTTQPTAGLASANCPAGSNSSTCQIYRAEFAVTPGRNDLYVWIVDVVNGVEVDRGIWRTSNGGTGWTQISETGITHCGDSFFGPDSGCGVQQGAYNLELAAIPNGTSTDLYAGTINIYKCTLASGGTSCTQGSWLNLTHVYGCDAVGALGAPAHVHPDQHGLAFMVVVGSPSTAPGYFAHDGGISRTLDGYTGLTTGLCTGHNQFDSLSQTLGSISEFVSFSVHPTSADIMLGGTQDNGSPKTATGTSSTTWQNALGGDGGFNAINPTNGNEWFASNPGSIIGICEAGTSCDDTNFFLEAQPGFPLNGNIDQGPFYTPYILDPQNTGEMLIGTCRVWRGATNPPTGPGVFSQLSNDFDTLGTGLCTGGEVNQVASLAAGGPKDANNNSKVVYATTNGFGPFLGTPVPGGDVWVTTNAGTTTMANVTGGINPSHYPISSVTIDNNDTTGQTAYVGIMGFHTSHVWQTKNAGTSWTDWTGTGAGALPDAPVDALLVDSQAQLIYAGTDAGIFVSPTTGTSANWTEVGPAPGSGTAGFLPNAPVTAIQIFNNGVVKKLRVSTYGRGIWEFPLAVTPDFTNVISDSPQTVFLGQNATFHGTLAVQGGYNNAVNLSCTAGTTAPPTTCTLNPTQVPAPGSGTYTVTAGGAVGDYSFNAHAVGADANTTTHDAAITLHVVDFGLTPPPLPPVTAPQGGISNSTSFQVTAAGSFSGTVTLTCQGTVITAGATCNFLPSANVNPTAGSPVNASVTVSVPANIAPNNYTVTISANTLGAPAPKTTNFTLTVTVPDFAWTGGGSHQVLSGQVTPNYTFTATPAGATFVSDVNLSCSNLPAQTACNFAPSSVIKAGTAGAQTIQLTITSTGPNQGVGTLNRRAGHRNPWLPLTVPITGMVVVGFAGRGKRRRHAMAVLCVSLAFMGLLVACGGGSSSPPPPPQISVTVALKAGQPSSLFPNNTGWPTQTAQFMATVNNSSNQNVTWAVVGSPANGTIDANGVYTAPTVAPGLPGSVTIKATAQADATKSGSAVETLNPATIPGTYSSIGVTATDNTVTLSNTVTLIVN